jgi:hypothetical protein
MQARTKKKLLDDLKGLTVKSLYFDGRKDNGNYHRLHSSA